MKDTATVTLKVTINLADYATDHGDIDTDALTRTPAEIKKEICDTAGRDMLLNLMAQFGERFICQESHSSDLQNAGIDLS